MHLLVICCKYVGSISFLYHGGPMLLSWPTDQVSILRFPMIFLSASQQLVG